eukprot:5756381-Amphidinium_carterae.1
MEGINAVVRYVVTMGARGSEAALLDAPSRKLRYSRILPNVLLSKRPGCFSANLATLFESRKPWPREEEEDRDRDDDDPRRRLLRERPRLFVLALALAANSCRTSLR